MAVANNPNRRNRTQFAITHAIIVSWAIALLAPLVLFLIPMCTPETFLHYTFYFAFAVVLILLIPITINCRGRLHDVGRSGSYILRVFLPFSKVFKLLWSEGDPTENQFGQPPHYKIPRISYFAKILLAQGIVFSLVAAVCFVVPPYMVLTSSQPQQIKHDVTGREIESVYAKVRKAKEQQSTCSLTTKELNALINKNASLSQKLRIHSIHAGVMSTDQIQFEIDVNVKLDFLSQRYLTTRIELEVQKTAQKMTFYLKNMIGKQQKEAPSWLSYQDATQYVYQYLPELQQLRTLLDQIKIDYDWDNKEIKVTF